ncbi:MAG: hypothetical protein ACR2G3_06160 [Solirubrobacterales bacterium]
MPRTRRRASALAVTLLCILGLAACGSDEEGTIPPESAEVLLSALSEVEASVQSGDCTSATTDASQFLENVRLLPKQVGEETKADLFEAGNHLVELTQDPAKCQEPEENEEPQVPETGATGFSEEDG